MAENETRREEEWDDLSPEAVRRLWEEILAKARDRKAYELEGEYAYLNFPEEIRAEFAKRRGRRTGLKRLTSLDGRKKRRTNSDIPRYAPSRSLPRPARRHPEDAAFRRPWQT